MGVFSALLSCSVARVGSMIVHVLAMFGIAAMHMLARRAMLTGMGYMYLL